jgi:uncharacterized protein YlxP (DUF503 family)
MIVGVLRVVLSLPYNDSLKGKRSVVKSILERTRNRFHVSAAEIEDQDAHRRAVLGFACVSNDGRHAQSMLDKVVSFIAATSEAQLVDRAVSIEHISLGTPGLSEDRWNPPDFDVEFEDDDGDEER